MTKLAVGAPVPDGESRRPRRRELVGAFVSLVPVDPAAHAEALWACSHGDPRTEALWTYMPYGPFPDVAEMQGWLERCASSEDPLFFAVLDRQSAAPVGMASMLNVDPVMRHLELGHIWYGPAGQRSRANTEAAHLMLREAFDELDHRRVEWKCDALNERSRAAALRLGFAFEGIFRQHMIVKGRNRDTAWFAMLDGEWPKRKANIERWLASEPGSVSLRELNATG
jgi:RimJ/RimL family protein N-acetyltransferase